jgi:hypothetical protein
VRSDEKKKKKSIGYLVLQEECEPNRMWIVYREEK